MLFKLLFKAMGFIVTFASTCHYPLCLFISAPHFPSPPPLLNLAGPFLALKFSPFLLSCHMNSFHPLKVSTYSVIVLFPLSHATQKNLSSVSQLASSIIYLHVICIFKYNFSKCKRQSICLNLVYLAENDDLWFPANFIISFFFMSE